MTGKGWIGLMVLSVALAGCGDSGDDGPSLEELCDGFFADGVCTPHTEPSIRINDLATSIPAYTRIAFTWSLDNGTRGAEGAPVHSMDNRIVAIADGTVPTNTTDPRTDLPGIELSVAEHQNLPAEHSGEFSWETPGDTLVIWGYMRIEGMHIWQNLQSVTVTEPLPSGTTHTVSLSAGPPPTADNTNLRIVVGDAVAFQDDSPWGYSLSWDCADLPGGDAASFSAVFVEPRTCNWTANTPLAGGGSDPGALTGQVVVGKA